MSARSAVLSPARLDDQLAVFQPGIAARAVIIILQLVIVPAARIGVGVEAPLARIETVAVKLVIPNQAVAARHKPVHCDRCGRGRRCRAGGQQHWRQEEIFAHGHTDRCF